jgi:site-specific recombinase XerC
MLASGIRLSAAIGLDVEHLDLAAGEASIHTKGDRTERVFLGKELCEHLRRFVGDRTAGPLFTSDAGGRRVSNRHIQRRFGRRYTSQIRYAWVREAMGSFVGMNSWPMWPW